MTCYSTSVDPLSLGQRYHIVSGKLSMKADAMLAEFRTRGGKHRVVKRDAEQAAVELSIDGQSLEFAFTWDEAKSEPFVYTGKESENIRFIAAGNKDELAKRLKSKYASPRSRMQMLWARVISDGVRTMMPEVNLGTYTPEEINDFAVGGGEREPSSVAPAEAPATTPIIETPKPAELTDVVPGHPTVTNSAGSQAATGSVVESSAANATVVESSAANATAVEASSQPVVAVETADSADSKIGQPMCEQTRIKLDETLKAFIKRSNDAMAESRIVGKLKDCGMHRFGLIDQRSAELVIDTLSRDSIEEYVLISLTPAVGNESAQ